MFKKLEGDTAILAQKGVFKQVDLYEWRGDLFAKWGGGYIRLTVTGGTSIPDVILLSLATDQPFGSDQFGRLTMRIGVRVLTGDERDRLLEGPK
jgi:hypothetical protein